MDKFSYALGMSMAQSLAQSGITNIEFDDFAAAVKDFLTGQKPALELDEANRILDEFFEKMQAAEKEKIAELSKVMKEEGEKFLAENAKKEGVVVLPSGLQYKVITEGTGRKAKATDTVNCDYEGRFISGNVFDSSYQRGHAAEFGVNQVIKGWTEALQLMPEGSKWELYIPYDLAYGEQGAGAAIPPFATLIFTVEVHKVL